MGWKDIYEENKKATSNSAGSGGSWKDIYNQNRKSDYETIYSSTGSLGNRIYSSLNSRNYADSATIEQLRGNINEYKSNVNSLKEAGYDVGKAMSGFADIDNAFSQYENYWQQFGSAEQYYDALDKYNAYQDKYGKYTSYDDYADISKQRPNEKIDITDFDKYEARKANNYTYNIDGTVTDIFGDVVDETYNERIQQPLVKDRLGAWLNSSDADKNRYLASDSVSDSYGWNDYSQTMRRGTEGYWDEIKPEEIDLYYYLYNTQGADKAYQYLDDMFTEFEARQAQKEAEAVNNAGIGTQILLNAASVPLNVIGGVPAYLSDLGKIITNQDIDYNDTAHYMSRMASNIRGKTATDIEKATNNLALPFIDFTFGDAYQSLMSGADSALGATMFGKGYTVMMGMSAASSEAKRLFDKGASRGQILAGSVLGGAAEIVFESVSLDHFLKTKDTKTLKQLAVQILKQAGVEGSEEVATDIANLINNLAVMGKDADVIDEINGYMAEGDSKASASAKALLSFAEDLGSSFLGGALSGGAMGGIGSTANLINYNSYTKSAGESVNLQGNVSDVATNAKAIAEQNKDKKTIKRAEQISDKVNKGSISKSDYKDIGKLYDYAVNDKNEKITDVVKEEAKRILNEKSVGNAEKISTAVADVYEGTASEAQKDLVNKNGGEKLVNDAVKAARENAKTSERLAELYDAESKAYAPSSNKTVFESLNEAKDNVLDDTIDEENADNIASIKEAKNGNVVVTLEDGTEKNLNDVTFANADTALVYESVKAIGYDTETANSIVNAYKATKGTIAENFILGMKQGYQYGLTNNTKAFSDAKGYFADLSEANRNLAYRLGQEASQRKFAPLNIENKNGNKPKGRVVIASELRANITERQSASLSAIGNVTSKVTGNNVVIYASTEENNKRVLPYDIGGRKKGDLAPNGFYDPKTGTIYLDLYAGNNGEGTMLWTYSHELTHFVRQWSPDKFKSLADFLVDEYGKSGKNIEELIASQMAKAKRNGRSLDYDTAYEEVVADFMQTMFTDTNLAEKLAQIKAKDETLFQKIKSFFVNLLKKIKEAYAGLEPSSEEAKFVKNMGDSVQKVVDLFAEGIVEAGQNFNIGSINLSDYSAAITENGEQLFQYRAMEADEARYRAMLEKTNVIDKTQIDDLFGTINEALATIKGNLEALDYAWEADIDDRSFAPAKPNSDSLYQVSIDFSTLCRKRLLQQGVQNMLQAALGREITKEEGIVIRDALKQVKEEGREIEVACALCYVESARMKSNVQIQKFLDSRESLIKEFFAGTDKGETKKTIAAAEKSKREEIANRYNNNAIIKMSLKGIKSEYGGAVADEIREAKKAVKRAYEPTPEQISLINKAKTMTVSDFTTPEGLTNLAKNYPQLFDAYTSFVRNATKSKGVESDVWWRAGDSKSIGDALIEKMNAENGLRSQSWSDFQVIHLMDYIAAIIELSTRNAKMQAYTKVPDYVRLMGLTNQMINLSLIPAAKFNGSLEYDSVEGIDYQAAIDLRDKYPDTAGTICIGINTEQIKMLLADDTIDYVIPYHQSGMSKKVRGLMHIPTWESFEKFQNETKFASRAEAEENAKKMGVAIDEEKYGKKPNFSDWFNYNRAKAIEEASKSESNPLYGGYMAMRDAAENYKKVCASRGLKPKFESLANEANYWKLLIDRKMVNQKTGAVIEQKAVKPIFDRNEVLGILNREIERYPSVKMDQDYATRTVLNKFASGEFDKKLSALTLKSLKNNLDKLSQYNIIKSEENTQQMNSDRDEEKFNLLYTTLEDGRIKPKNVKDLSTEDWKIIYKAVNKLGYGLKSVKDAKDGYSEYVGDTGFNKEQSEAIMKEYGVGNGDTNKANPERAKTAKKEFGTTTDFREAGYLLQDGYMLDFSGKKEGGPSHVRYMDHREISRVFKRGEVESKYGDNTPFMNAFISEGNIRLMESQGVTIGEIEPSAKQYPMLKLFINHVLDTEGYFYLDLSNNQGLTVASREYGKGDGSARIIQDIKSYFKNGELPYRSSLNDFRYSDRDAKNDADYSKPITAEDIEVIRSIGRKSINDFTSEDIQKSAKWAYKFYKELGTKSPFFRAWFGDYRSYENDTVKISEIPEYEGTNEARKANRGIVTNADTGWDIRISREGETNTISHSGANRLSEYGLSGIRSLIENGILLDSEVHEHHSNNSKTEKTDRIAFDHKIYALGQNDEGIGLYRITIEESFANPANPNDKRFHNLKYIEKVADIGSLTRYNNGAESTNDVTATTYSISDLFNLVKTYDKDFNAGKVVNPAMLNEDGTPRVFYHGTRNSFSTFDKNRRGSNTRTGISNNWFFAADEETARSYYPYGVMEYLYKKTGQKQYDPERLPAERRGNLYSLYISAENPLVIDVKDYDYAVHRENADAWTEFAEEADKNGNDAIILLNALDNQLETSRKDSTVVLFRESSQAKSATDNIGTFDGNNDDIRYSDRDYSANIDSAIAREYGTKTNEEFKALVEKAKSEMVKDTESNDNFANVESSIGKVIDWLSEIYDSKARLTDDAKNLLKEIRSTRVYLNEQQKQEVKNRYGSYKKYVQSLFGRMKIADSAGVAISEYYNELANKHPELFDKNANSNEIPLLMSEAIDRLQNTFEVRDTDFNMQRDSMFNDIFRMIEENIEQERFLATDPRTILSRALMSVAQNDSEKMTLAHYKNAIKELNNNQKLLADASERIAELSRSTDEEDMITLDSLKDAAKQLTAEINRGDKKLLNLEATKPLKELLARETKKAADQARELGTKAFIDYRTKVEDKLNTIKDMVKRDKVNGYYVPRIEKTHTELTELIAHPTAKKHIPMAFNSAVANFLKVFDFSDFTKTGAIKNTNANFSRLNARAALQALAQRFDENTKDDAYNNVEIAPEMRDWLRTLTNTIETAFSREYVESLIVSDNGTIYVNQLSEESLKNLYRLVRGLKATLNRAGRYYDNNARDVSTDAESTMHFTEPLAKKNPSSLLYKVSKTFMWDYAQPITAFMRFGEGGMARYRELIKAQSKMAYHQQKLNEFIDSAYSESEAQEWQKTFVTIKLDGKDYQASVEQLMSLHCLLKQEDSRRHMLEGGGIRLSDNVVDGKIVRYEDSFVSVEEATEIEKMLKRDFPRAVEVADKMQEYMDTVGTDWGNEISMARFGFKQFGVTNYFPIRTIKAGSELEAQQRRANIYALLNKSFTKERNIKANNTIVVSGIFNVFSNHMAEMALYNAWALPVLDLLKWYNYKEGMDIDNKLNERSVVRSLELAYGNYADEYIRRLLESINSQQSGGLSESIAFTNLRMFNRVAVAGNIRVAVQQPFSITRAMDVIAPKYIRLLSTKDRKAAYNEMIANSGIAVWKSLGYYDVDIALPFEKSVRKGETFADKFTEKSMALAEAGDNYTWATLWNACKTEQKTKNPNISNEELLAKTTDRFNDVILQTQVVDTVLQKSQWMRSTSFWHRMTSSFMSEPMTSYNMLLRKFDAYSRDLAVMDKKSAFNKNFKPIAKSMLVFAITELVNALVTAPIDAARDDDDYKTYWQKLLENFKDNAIQNLIPLNMMPYLADIVEYIVYGKTDRPDMQILTKVVDLANSVKNVISNYDYIKLHKTIKSVLDMASSLSGLPMGNMTRDVISLWNTVVGDVNYGQLKFQTSKDSSAVGYDNMYEAIQKGNTERAAYLYAQLLSNSVDPSSIYSGLVSRMKDDYIDKEITEDEAKKYLREISDYTGKGLTDNDIYWWFDEYRHKREGSADKYTKYAEFFTAIDSGESLELIVKKYTDNEVSTSTLASRITSNYKATYINASESERKILKEKLLKAYEALGYDREKKSKDIDKWLK